MKTLPELSGVKIRDDIHWFTNPAKAYDFGEVMAENGFSAIYETHGNVMAVVVSHIEPLNPRGIAK